MEMNNVVKLAVDAYKNSPTKGYSVADSLDTLTQALVAANNGKTSIDYKSIRNGECKGLFALVEEILSRTIVDGFQGDEYFNSLVDFRNVPLGDQNIFEVEDGDEFIVADAAEGTQGISRQRIGGVKDVSIPTVLKTARVYEELNRVLSGRVDFNTFIRKTSEAFRKKLLDDIYAIWSNATSSDFGGTDFFPVAGAYDEDALLEAIAHVEAAAGGKTATLIGTKKAVRNLAPSIQGDNSQSDIYNMGYYGKFYGSSVVVTPQRHKVGSTEFIFPDNTITIIAGDEKPVKCVYEGNPLFVMGDPFSTQDLTMNFLYGERYGMGIVLAGGNSGIGRYEMI